MKSDDNRENYIDMFTCMHSSSCRPLWPGDRPSNIDGMNKCDANQPKLKWMTF